MDKLGLKDGFAARLGKTVEDSGMSTKEAARRCGVGAATMTAYMSANNANLPTLATFAEICGVFHVSADWLLLGKDGTTGR